MENLIKDIRYGVRMLVKNPGVTLVAVITLALGIGANTAIFSGVSAFLMRPLSVPNPSNLVRPMEIAEDRGVTDEFSYPDFVDYRDQSTSYTGLAAEDMLQVAIDAENQNDVIWGQVVSANYFDVARSQTDSRSNIFAGRGQEPRRECGRRVESQLLATTSCFRSKHRRQDGPTQQSCVPGDWCYTGIFCRDEVCARARLLDTDVDG